MDWYADVTLWVRLVGYGYHLYYKNIVLSKIDNAFNAGDPALRVAIASRNNLQDPWYKKLPAFLSGAQEEPAEDTSFLHFTV